MRINVFFILCILFCSSLLPADLCNITELGQTIEYGPWSEADDCSCGADTSRTLEPSWSLSSSVGISIGFLSANFGITPPSDDITCYCNSDDCNHKILWKCTKTIKRKFEAGIVDCDVPPPPGITAQGSWADWHCGTIYQENLYHCTQTTVVYCPECPWNEHPCKYDCAPKDKIGNIILPDPPCCDGLTDKNGNPISYPIRPKPDQLDPQGSFEDCSDCDPSVPAWPGPGDSCATCDDVTWNCNN